jgi:predicted SprT family Zn-dependent metalloprotease
LACGGDWEIRLNVYIAAQCPDEFRNTVSHEIAHMVDFAMRGRSAHDRIWKVIHRSLGGNGARCSAYTGNHIRIRAKNEYLYRNYAGAETWCGPKHHAALHRGDIAAIRNKLSGHRFIASDWTGESRILR